MMSKIRLLTIVAIAIVSIHGCNTKSKSETTESRENTEEVLLDKTKTDDLKVQYNTDQVMQAALDGKFDVVEIALHGGFDVDAVGENKRTLLMLAAFNGNTQIVKMLLAKGADVNKRDAINRTALMYASTGPFVPTVELLLKSGAEPNITDNEQDWTAAMMAAAEGQLEVLKVLVNNGADLGMVDVDGESSLYFAKANGHTEVVKYIESQTK